jgi:hypothetical protein
MPEDLDMLLGINFNLYDIIHTGNDIIEEAFILFLVAVRRCIASSGVAAFTAATCFLSRPSR